MKTHSNLASRLFGILAMVAVGWLQPTAAYGQTPEGTDIDNIATVIYTDANSNTYSPVISSMVRVTVGFSGAVSVVAAQATASPASPSLNNTLDFDVINLGNGTDSVVVAVTNTDLTVLTFVKFTLNTIDYFTLGDLNDALAGIAIAPLGTETITVTYDIEPDKGGQSSTYTLTATSRRPGAATDNANTVVTPGFTGTVVTTPDAQAVPQLPNNGGDYTFPFDVTNNQNGVDDFDLLVTLSGSVFITIVSVDGVLGASTTITNLAVGETRVVNVVYSVATLAAAGATETLFLDATSVVTSETDQGSIDVTVIKANLTILKEAWDDLRFALISADVLPGDFIEYKVTITNTGTADATNVHVDDLLPSEVTYISAEGDVALDWGFTILLQDFDADLTPVLVNGSPRVFWIRVQVN
ncbi:MAG: DUF11 domain-containing protein [Gemmatimonadetes bacterium]|nr:DUF11 domain-containing protein [Gemmatimonadota bacterium]